MNEESRRVVIAYDICDDRRRQRVAKVLLSYGDRVQFSVFVADGGRVKLARMKRSVVTRIDATEDSVLFIDLGPTGSMTADRFSYAGVHRPTTSASSFIM